MQDKLNILMISNLYPPFALGGAEMVVCHLAESLASRGHRITVVSTADPSRLRQGTATGERLNGVEIIRFFPRNLYWPFDHRHHAFPLRFVWHLRDAWNTDAARKLRPVIRMTRPDIIHTHNISGFSPIVWPEAGRAGIPLIHTVHDCHLICPRSNMMRRGGGICAGGSVACMMYRKWNASRLKAVNVMCFASRATADLHAEYAVGCRSVRVIPYGIPAQPAPSRRPAGPDRPVRLLYLGQLEHNKGPDRLLQALSLLGGEKIELHVAGRGSLEPTVREAAANDGRIHFHGFVTGEEKLSLLRTCDILALPSICHDNSPIAVMEALMNGMAVVATRVGGLPELVEEGVTGSLVSPGDADALARALLGLIRSPDRLRSYQTAALDKAGRFTAAAMTASYEDLYYTLVNSDVR